ncbi:MAG: hypothetical protein NC489_11565 [Ruminococcus flavefaciens]|nr:hypothetical protein [Ruminococcus flavefaciens]
MEDFSIFMESNEDIGLLFSSYKDIGRIVNDFLKVIEDRITLFLRDPKHSDANLSEEISKFKKDVNKHFTPKPIDISTINRTKGEVKKYRIEMEKVLDRYAKARDRMSFGGNLVRAIIRRPKAYSKEIDPESYDRNNKNIRNIGRALDWVEKVMIDLFNLIDQDLNILTIVGKVYGKRKIYETADVLDTLVEDINEATIGEYKNGILRIPVANTKYKARVEQLIRRYQAPIDSADIILVIHGRESFINEVMKDCGYTRKQAEEDFDVYKVHGYIMTNNPLQVNIAERKYAAGGFNQTYEMLVLHECTHSIVNSIPQAHVLTSNFQEGIAIYESGMLKHMLEKFNKSPSVMGRKHYPLLLRSTIQVSNIIKKKGYGYLIKIIKGSIPEPTYDDFMNENVMNCAEQTDSFMEAKEDKDDEKANNGDKKELKEEVKKESSKNGVRRKQLYVAFIEWAKEYNAKNTFGSIFDKDIFHNVYPFVPNEMRYFYRLANPILCVLSGDLTFFQVSELKKLNSENKELDKYMIFAATPNDLRIFNRQDKRVYVGKENDGKLELGESVGESFDLYIQNMIKKGDILNGETSESNQEE